MKKILALLLTLVLVFALTACAKPEPTVADPATSDLAETTDPNDFLAKIMANKKLVVATSPDYAPCEFVDPTKTGQDQYVGSDIEFAKYLADKLGVELVLEIMDFDSIQAAVQMGTVDMGISGFSYTEKRAQVVALSDPYFTNDYGQGLLVPADKVSFYNSAESFAGKKVAAQNGSLQQQLATEQLPGDVTLEIVTNINDAVLMLLTGKVDAIAASGENGEAIAGNYPEIAMCDFKFEIEGEGYVVMMQQGQDALIAKVNEIVGGVVQQNLYLGWLTAAQELQKELGIE